MARSHLTAALAALVLPAAVEAAKVKTWHHAGPSSYEKAQLKGTAVSSEGSLRLARHLRPLAGLDATHVWGLAEDADGNLYAATGDDGKLFKVTPAGQVSVAHTAEDSQVLCVTVGAEGAVYAGTGPSGKVLRIDAEGRASVWYETGDGYVWALAFDPKTQAMYAATGPKGRIHRIDRDGRGRVHYACKQDHVLCLAVGPDGTLYAGTDKGGLVYRIDGKGKGFVLFQAPQPEVRRLIVTDGGLYACTSAPTRRRGASAAAEGDYSPLTLGNALAAAVLVAEDGPAKGVEKLGEGASGKSEAKESKESKGTAASAPSAPASGENSVFRISFDGTAREVFREKALLLSMLVQDGRLLVGTGMDGQLFEADAATREKAEVARLNHGQVLSLCRRRDGSVVVGTGDPGKLYVLQERFARKGTVVSEPLDAKLLSKWGALRWQADVPEGTTLTVAVRSGNVAEPDDTWSDWSAEMSEPEKATIAAPPARFLQYRVTLTADKSGHASPSLRALTLRYAHANVAPEVTKVEVPDLNAKDLDNPKKLKIKWTATDANEDELTYAVYVRKDGWKNWVLLDDELDKSELEWDTTSTPSGLYQVKVVASDRKDNTEGEALTGEKVSVPFVVCHTPPAVSVKVVGLEGDAAVVEASATSPLVRLASASFAVNGKKWTNVFPEDGLFDGKSETFRFKTEGLKPGTYVLVLKVKDAAGNVGSSDVVFTVQAKAP
jgi:outer membrane protein assembly factor BamB